MALKILFVGSGTGDHLWALHLNRYSDALQMMGHAVIARSYRNVEMEYLQKKPSIITGRYDLLILQDTHLRASLVERLIDQSSKYVLFTHSELIQGERDKAYIRKTHPDYIFTDQPMGVELFSEVDTPVTWMGHGADHKCYCAENKDIDVLWVGNQYTTRDPDVQREVIPLLDTEYNVKIYGRGYPHGAIKPSQMFDLMARARIAIHIGHPVTDKGGYSGTRISDALASGCYVVSTKYPKDKERYPEGVCFAGRDEIGLITLGLLYGSPTWLHTQAMLGYNYVRKHRMARNDMELVLEKIGHG